MNRITDGVWPELPSTAQFASPGQYGFLLLSDSWLESQGVGEAQRAVYVQDGPKWPVSAGGPRILRHVLRHALTSLPISEATQETIAKALMEVDLLQG
jgi:hypothetical protein